MMILNEIDQKAKDLSGNTLSLWNDPSVGMVLPIIHWHPASYGLVSFECDTEEHAEQLFLALQNVRSFEAEIPEDESASAVCWQGPIEEAARDLITRGFEDVTKEEGKYPGGDDAYVFRGPDGVLYHCCVRPRVFDVLSERDTVASMMASRTTDTHFFRGADGMYHCLVSSKGEVWPLNTCVDCGTTEGVEYRTAFARRLCFSCDRFRMQDAVDSVFRNA